MCQLAISNQHQHAAPCGQIVRRFAEAPAPADRRFSGQQRPRRQSSQRGTARAADSRSAPSSLPRIRAQNGQLEQRRQAVRGSPAADACADERRRPSSRTCSRRDDPGQVRVDAEQHRDAVQVEQEREAGRATVWRPRNGEKPKKTPSAKAAAVRSGVSSMWSSVSSQRADQLARDVESSKVAEPGGSGCRLDGRRRSLQHQRACSRVQTPMRVSGTPLPRGAVREPCRGRRGRTVNSSS